MIIFFFSSSLSPLLLLLFFSLSLFSLFASMHMNRYVQVSIPYYIERNIFVQNISMIGCPITQTCSICWIGAVYRSPALVRHCCGIKAIKWWGAGRQKEDGRRARRRELW